MEAWQRYTNDAYTCDDLALLLDAIKEDDRLHEFKEVFDKEWFRAMIDTPPTAEDRKEAYRKEAAQFLAEYQRKKQMQTTRMPARNNTVRLRKIFYAAAAVLLLGLLIPTAYYYLKPKTDQTIAQYIEMETQRGEIKTIFLPDQTKVMLNAGSRMKYPAIFTGDERLVELYGEALFDVTSDPERPFIVKTDNMKIKVVGTVFDVKEYSNDLRSSVTVSSGNVEVSLAGGKVWLEHNNQVKMNKTTGDFEKLTIDADKYLSWTDGTLYFHRTPIREVVNMLNRHYPQVDIQLAEGDYSILISGEHDNKSLEAVLTSIVYSTGLKYKKTGRKYTLFN